MFNHAPPFTGSLSFLHEIQVRGYLGVGLFLILSGFSIHFRWAAAEELGHFAHQRFWRRRFRRLYPGYLAAFGLALVVYVAWLGQGVSGREWPWGLGVPSAAVAILAQLILPVSNILPYTYVGVAWTLGLELQLYAMYTVVVRKLREFGVWRVLAVTLVGSLVFRTLLLIAAGGGSFTDASFTVQMLWSWGPSRMFEWALGMAAAEAYFGRLALPRITSSWIAVVALLALGLGIESISPQHLVLGISPRDIVYDAVLGVGFFALLRALIAAEYSSQLAARLMSPLAFVGVFSYSLYVTHLTLWRAGFELLHRAGVQGANHQIVIAAAFVLVCAYIFYWLFERPFLVRTRVARPAVAT